MQSELGMAFFKFKLESNTTRTAPVPIAAAVSQPPSTCGDGHVQQGSPMKVPSQKPTAGGHDMGTPVIDPRARCNKRQGPSFRREAACVECKMSKTRCEKPATRVKDKCRRCLQQNMECVLYLSTRLPSVKQFATQTVPLSTTRECHAPQMQRGTPLYYGDGKEGTLEPDASLEKVTSTAFLMGLNAANLSSNQSPCIRRHQLDRKVGSFFDPETAERIFHQYINSFASKCPIVVFPPGTTAAFVRETKPFLLLSILGIASAGYCTADKQRELAFEIRGYLAESAIVRGEKSLELVQALQVASLWYRAPDTYTQMNQNQLVSITTTMALDLGLDRIEVSNPDGRAQDMWERAEAERAWLGCFLLSASLSLILRRPNTVMWNSKLDEYLDDLQQIKASSTDTFLCMLITTERHCHDMNQRLSLSDPFRSISLYDPKTIMKLQDFQSQINWPPLGQIHSIEKSLVQFGRFASSLYAHELALHVNHNIDEFQAPFFAKSLKTCGFVDTQDLSTSHLSMLRSIMLAAQGLLDTFLSLSISDMLALPPHIYGGRVIYAVILLMKLHKGIMTPAREVIECIHGDELRLEAYIEQLVLISNRLIAKDGCNTLSRALLIMPQLKEWFNVHLANENKAAGLLRNKTGGGSLSSAIQTPIGTLSGPSVDIQAPDDHSHPLDGPGYQFDGPLAQGWDQIPETSRGEVTSDSWFWEFFNVDMLH